MCVAWIKTFWLDVRHHNKLWCGNNFNHWKFLVLVLDFNYFSFSHPNPNPNPTHLPKHESLSHNHQFSQRIWYVEYWSVHAHMAWSQKFRKSEISLDICQTSSFYSRGRAGNLFTVMVPLELWIVAGEPQNQLSLPKNSDFI